MGRIIGLVIKPIENGNGGAIDNNNIDNNVIDVETLNSNAVTDNTTKKVRRSTR